MNDGETAGGDAELPPRQPTRYHDDSTYASDPVPVAVDGRRLRMFCPQLFGWSGRKAGNKRLREIISEHMRFGDSRAAVVVSSDPLLVAAYTDELDCVSILRFSPGMPIPELAIGSRLLTVNTYKRGKNLDVDLFPGPLQIQRWVGFYPIIADFICANQDVVDRRKSEIDEREWERTLRLGHDYLNSHPGLCRDGSPCKSATPPKANVGAIDVSPGIATFSSTHTDDFAAPARVRDSAVTDLDQMMGKRLLVGITYLATPDQPERSLQFVGLVTAVDPVVTIDRGSDRPFTLPPMPEAFDPAPPGEYRLRSTGEVVSNPDFVTTWTVSPPEE